MPPLEGLASRRLIVGLTGGIACYKVAYVVSALAKAGAEVTVVMTEAATRFVTPLTFQALSGRPVYSSQWEHLEAHDPQHIATARAAELMLIAPCTMNMLSKLATGRADDAVSVVAAAMDVKRRPVLLAPSMNETMYRQASTQRNLAQLRADGFHIIEPATGWQACGTVGVGRLPEPADLLREICATIPAAQ
ncbi:MAG: phosphopantothenoylcysteine decarboxylase [Phycisphaerales bacterium]|nr:MAG: phosphopantothenoylcysteine decarboxylase [Phycisphaerales bacterium]